MTLKLLCIFALTEFLLSLTPGPAVLLVVSQGLHSGFRSSVKGALGILTGNAIYFALSALGLGTLLLASARLFEVIRWLGVAYLILLGIKMVIFAKGKGTNTFKEAADSDHLPPRGRSLALFSEGLITQLSNPKAIVFFTALLPQFVSPGLKDASACRFCWDGALFFQFLVLGIVSIAVEFPVLVCYGSLAERGGRLIPKRFASLPERIAGGFLVAVGIGLARTRP